MAKRTAVLIGIALLFAVSWFLPVIKDGATLAQGELPGWQAFRASLSAIWPYEPVSGAGPWHLTILSVASGLSNLVFLVALQLAKRPGVRVAAAGWVLMAVTLVNAHWLLLADARGDLRVGYFAWLLAFAALTLRFFLDARTLRAGRAGRLVVPAGA